MKAYKSTNENLQPEESRVLSKFLEDFERNGLNIDSVEKRNELAAKKKRVAELCLEFNKSMPFLLTVVY